MIRNNKRLYESIMKDVAKTVKRCLNEDDENFTCTLSYANDSVDGYILVSKKRTFKNEQDAINHFYKICKSSKYPLDKLLNYISNTKYEILDPYSIKDPQGLARLEKWYDEIIKNPYHKNIYIGIKYNTDLPDPYNEGGKCEGCYILEDGNLWHSKYKGSDFNY